MTKVKREKVSRFTGFSSKAKKMNVKNECKKNECKKNKVAYAT